MEHQGASSAISAFNSTYPALKSAFQLAMGDSSMGINSMNPLGKGDKTATEVRASTKQQLARDAYNQIYLEEFLKDVMGFWIKMDQQYLFTDPTKENIIVRVVGKDVLNELKNSELAQTEMPDEVVRQTADLIEQTPGGLADEELEVIKNVSETPKFPVVDDAGEVRPKLDIAEDGLIAQLFVEKDDLMGIFDYVPDVKSMQIGVSEEAINGRNQALYILLSPGVQQQLQQEGVKINVKDLLINVLEDNGVKNARKLFEDISNGQQPTQIPGGPGALQPGEAGNIPQPTGIGNTVPGGSPTGPATQQGLADFAQLFTQSSDLTRSVGLPN
jgi:hypothetical protein